MSQASVYKPLKPYTPKNLVHGFVVPSCKDEKLICVNCVRVQSSQLNSMAVSGWRDQSGDYCIPVTFDGEVKCARCKNLL